MKRIVVPGLPHHVTQRGVRRCETFLDVHDREVYERLLLCHCERYSLAVLAYCWMTTHIHMVAVPDYEASLALVLRDTNGLYAVYFNRKYGFAGHLWQARFYSCVLGESHFWRAVRYVERNPVRAKMVLRAEDYRWSSAAAHCLRRKDPLLTDLGSIPPLIADWSTWLADEEDPAELTAIRRNTGTGRPWGDKAFLEKLEARLGRPVTPQKRGRKPQSQSVLSTLSNRREA